MDQKKLIGSLALALIALLMAVLFVLPYIARLTVMDGDGMVYDETQLIACSFQTYGDDLDSLYSLSLVRTSQNQAQAEMRSREYHGAKEQKKKKTVSVRKLWEIEEIARQNGMMDWDFPLSDIQALDAAVSTLSLDTGTRSASVSDNEALPEGAWAAVNEIVAVLESCFE